ncbi:hypothetical protein AZ34_10355 [Hylemonella gracilis str. Niagara R]|uniref:Uncharacterized protein n=1 Tax=Hylemonella gracilis str. Niagara R TaxID=1458275 RepID=A0A016XLT5_9BURK|nr:hypothetical protein [Hylemonella gracilis]EYC52870.1 hypothetical protein AZ34_10355 [Hylemonella gracilis str. Niagara R]
MNGSADYTPKCIPVSWTSCGSYWLAYHHGWTDARFYDVVEIPHDGRPQSAFAGYLATVGDFGDLVRISHRPYVQIGRLELD